MDMTTIRKYSDLRLLETFEERFKYVALSGQVGAETFGFDRYMNQAFYTSREWRTLRNAIIVRDEGRDLGVKGHEIYGNMYIHHLNPMTPDDIKHGSPSILNPENLITTCHTTHNAIHYGDERQLLRPLIERSPGDTKLW